MLTRHLGAAMCVMALAACTDPASAPMADDLVAQATEMEQFALQAAAKGDVQVSADINFIANALRKGVRPRRFEAFTGERWEVFNAIVRVEEHLGPEPASHTALDHNLLIWHYTPVVEDFHVMRMMTSGEHGRMNMVPDDPGVARYMEVAGDVARWDAFEGMGLIVEREVGGLCAGEDTPQAETHRVRCFKAQYLVSFELKYQPAHEEVGPESHWMLMWSRPQLVNGIKWVATEID